MRKPGPIMPPRPDIVLTSFDEEKFWSRVDRSGGPESCWLWTAGSFKGGYGAFKIAGKTLKAHRVSWVLANGQIPYRAKYPGFCVCHNCPGGDEPRCVNPAHLFLGEQLTNIHDMMKKGRAKYLKGDAHYAHLHPELCARGDNHGSRLHPESVPRGDNHHSRLRPERLARGEKNGTAKLNDKLVIMIRSICDTGKISQAQLGALIGISTTTISNIAKRISWSHVPEQKLHKENNL